MKFIVNAYANSFEENLVARRRLRRLLEPVYWKNVSLFLRFSSRFDDFGLKITRGELREKTQND